MRKIAILAANGCEEIETLAVVDVLRRADVEIQIISVEPSRSVVGSHQIAFCADALWDEADLPSFDGVVLPGGMPGTLRLKEREEVRALLQTFARQGKLIAAICAAPSILGAEGLLKGKRAVCHPGFEQELTGAVVLEDPVVTDGNIITGRGMGTAIEFALALVAYEKDEALVEQIKEQLVYRGLR